MHTMGANADRSSLHFVALGPVSEGSNRESVHFPRSPHHIFTAVMVSKEAGKNALTVKRLTLEMRRLAASKY